MNITEKYRPKSFAEFVGYQDVVNIAKSWITSWIAGKPLSKILILHGQAGVGKTTLAYVLAKEYKLPIIEVNGSDDRTIKKMATFIRSAMLNPFDSPNGKKIMLIDEADILPSRTQKHLLKMLEHIRHPIIMTCNDYDKLDDDYHNKFFELYLGKPTEAEILRVLKPIIDGEHLSIPSELCYEIAERCKSMRSAINCVIAPSSIDGVVFYTHLDTRGCAKGILEGKDVGLNIYDIPSVAVWLYDNSYAPAVLRSDYQMARYKRVGGKRFERYAVAELKKCRSERLLFPITWKLKKFTYKPREHVKAVKNIKGGIKPPRPKAPSPKTARLSVDE